MGQQYLFTTIFIGVVSGVITSAFIFLAIKIFNKIVIPWYQKLIYSGIDLSGTWYSYDEGMAQEVKIELSQKASTITGIATLIRKQDYQLPFIEDTRTFSISGFVKDRFIHLILKQRDKTRLGILTYLLESVGDGRTMKGAFTFYSVVRHEIQSGDVLLTREKSSFENNIQLDFLKEDINET